MNAELQFDPVKHEYRDAMGELWPGVTQMIGDVLGQNIWWTDYARQRGTDVHETLRFHDEDDLGECPAVAQPYLEAWRKFLREWDVEVLEIEQRVQSNKWRYAGTLDRVLRVKGLRELVDIKTAASHSPRVDIQTALYALAYAEQHPGKEQKLQRRRVVYVRGDGSYDARHVFESAPAQHLWIVQAWYWRRNNEPQKESS